MRTGWCILAFQRCASCFVILVFTCVVGTAAQWRGVGRIAGKVTDQDGTPLESVLVKAFLPSAQGGSEAKTNRRGEWAIGGITGGLWQIDFVKAGYKTRQIAVTVSEYERISPIEITLETAEPVVDPNAEIREGLLKAADLMNGKRYAEARQVYQALLEKYPAAHQLHPLVARTYYGERQFAKSIEHLRLALEKDPNNVEVKLLLGNVLIENGDVDEGKRLLAAVDEAAVKEPTIFVNVGIVLLNQNKPTEALAYLDRAVSRFPTHPDAYYYRGIAHVQQGNHDAARADLAKFMALAAADASELPMAKQILEKLK